MPSGATPRASSCWPAQLFALTGRDGEDWLKAQALGRQIDPDNPLYQPGGQPDMLVPKAAAWSSRWVRRRCRNRCRQGAARPDPPSRDRWTWPANLDLELDLDLDGRTSSDTAPMRWRRPGRSPPAPAMADDTRSRSTCRASAKPPASRRPCRAAADDGSTSTCGELTLDDASLAPRRAQRRWVATDDFGRRRCRPSSLSDDDADPLARKLELAEEFRQIGDMEGARDLLEEVLASADGALKTKAQGMLDSLS